MKYTLKDYQEEAVAAVLERLGKAKGFWLGGKDRSAFSLTATTGAGKTVMAAAVIEALFHGSDKFKFEKDEGAVVVWFSDDPSLNEQSRYRLHEASDMLRLSDLRVVDGSFSAGQFEAGCVYFLNTQKLGKSSLLVRGHDPSDAGVEMKDGQPVMPDRRSFTIWDTIRNTIEDRSRTLYLVLDEAHRGMKLANGSGERQTIVRKLINGMDSVPGVPIVWGISATVDRFNKAMEVATNRMTLPSVIVDAGKVQDSGLLKDDINLDVPKASGKYDTVLVGYAADKLRDMSAAWQEYAKAQGDAKVVKPLMVLQVANTPDPAEVGRLLDAIFARWPDLDRGSVAHVFGDHTAQKFGRHVVPYIAPESVQEATWIRILVAKDAISTGWDCPRAEVMISFRPAKDATHITQLLGRMVRTPLARRIAGDGVLNSVDCILPFFDRETVESIAEKLMKGDDGNEDFGGRRVLVNSEEMRPNPDIPEEVWLKFESLPSQALPRRSGSAIRRLTELASHMAFDGLKKDAGKKAYRAMHGALDGAAAQFSREVEAATQTVMTVHGETLRFNLAAGEGRFIDFVEAADQAAIDEIYRRAERELSPQLAKSYAHHLAFGGGSTDDAEQALIDARTKIAALGLVPAIVERLEEEAEKLFRKWLGDHRVEIKNLPDARRQIYRDAMLGGTEPVNVELVRPRSSMQPSSSLDNNKQVVVHPRYQKHLLCGEDRLFPMKSSTSWEPHVLSEEMKDPCLVAWYRNPSRGGDESLGACYKKDKDWKVVRPDFIFFVRAPNGEIVADIVDPHGTHLGDAMVKLIGLARYAETHGGAFRRIEAVAKIGGADGVFRVLDLQDSDTRSAIYEATSADALYSGQIAYNYGR